jgi:hypothetical protein
MSRKEAAATFVTGRLGGLYVCGMLPRHLEPERDLDLASGGRIAIMAHRAGSWHLELGRTHLKYPPVAVRTLRSQRCSM